MNRFLTTAAAVLTTLVAAAPGQLSPPPGHAMEFNGTSGHVRIEDHPLLDLTRTATFEMWVRPTAYAASDGADLLTKSDGIHDTDRAYEIGMGPVSDPQLGYGHFLQGGGWIHHPWPGAEPPVGEWTHVAITVDTNARSIRLYRNGVIARSDTMSSSASIRNSSRPVYLACRNTTCCGLGLYRFFRGAMDEVRLWNVVRTPEQIAASFATTVPANSPGLVAYYTFDEGAGATVQDRTGNGLNGTVNGGATWVEVGCAPPAATGQPVARTTCEGESVSFTAAFSGTSPSLQWRRDGQPLAGATRATLTIASPTVVDAGMYDCVATNACGSATTVAAMLEVTPLLAIASQPVDQQTEVGSSVSFFVEVQPIAGCSAAVTYQWQRRDPAVSDPNAPNAWIDLNESATFLNPRSSGLIITRPIPALATGYRCRIGGGCGCRPASGVIHTDIVNFTIACPADFNADGGVDFGDIETFFERWEDGC